MPSIPPVLAPPMNLTIYAEFSRKFRDEWRPVGHTESNLVQTLCDAQWRIHRAFAYELAIYANGITDSAAKLTLIAWKSMRPSPPGLHFLKPTHVHRCRYAEQAKIAASVNYDRQKYLVAANN